MIIWVLTLDANNLAIDNRNLCYSILTEIVFLFCFVVVVVVVIYAEEFVEVLKPKRKTKKSRTIYFASTRPRTTLETWPDKFQKLEYINKTVIRYKCKKKKSKKKDEEET